MVELGQTHFASEWLYSENRRPQKLPNHGKSHFPGRFKNVLLQIFHGITYIYHCAEGPLPMPKFNKRAKIVIS